MKKENIAIQNRVIMIIESAKRKNNYFDCDVVQDGIEQLEKATTKDEILDAAGYLESGLIYRGANISAIDVLINEIAAI